MIGNWTLGLPSCQLIAGSGFSTPAFLLTVWYSAFILMLFETIGPMWSFESLNGHYESIDRCQFCPDDLMVKKKTSSENSRFFGLVFDYICGFSKVVNKW